MIEREQARLNLPRDPVAFFSEVLGIDPWDRQVELIRAIWHHHRVAIRAGHKVSKSNTLAGVALAWVSTKDGARVVLTSSTFRQVKQILWRELRILHSRAANQIGGKLHDDPETGLVFPDGRQVFGFSTQDPDAAAGISGANVLFLVDEGQGVPRQIYEVLEGNAAGGAHIAVAGNPSQTSGTYFDAFHSQADEWHRIRISSEESPNVRAGRIVIPGLATREWVEDRKRVWGEDSDLYRVRVRGDFPKQASNAVISIDAVTAAVAAWEVTEAEGPLELGVDPAYDGADETVIFPRRGRKLFEPEVVRKLDGVEVAGKVLEVVRKHYQGIYERVRVKIDVVGIGASAADQLDHSEAARILGIEVVPVKSQESPTRGGRAGEPEYFNLRSQLWFGMADWLKDGGALPQISRLERDLVTPTFDLDNKNRLKVESKKEIRKRLGRSPDYGDAACLAVYDAPSAPTYQGLTEIRLPRRRM